MAGNGITFHQSLETRLMQSLPEQLYLTAQRGWSMAHGWSQSQSAFTAAVDRYECQAVDVCMVAFAPVHGPAIVVTAVTRLQSQGADVLPVLPLPDLLVAMKAVDCTAALEKMATGIWRLPVFEW